MATTKHTLVAIVQDKPGVLNRVASLFRRRNFNLDSISVGHTNVPRRARMTIVVKGQGDIVEQVRKQLEKLMEVIKAVDITKENHVTRELALIKVKTTPSRITDIMRIASSFQANIIDISSDSVIVEVVGDQNHINLIYEVLSSFGISEVARSGAVAIGRRDISSILEGESEVVRRYKIKKLTSSNK